ncbi:MAG: hypothetical protein A2X22_13470 [Bacteroidetes bacterium GWF2_49_14]|nr:MAG: hypothetical protein A2X22_13470 [Bacteroidetes bacterium GWF2_49_14]HBB93338.1 hypothetical protein [Bacteroidales bacterium]
MENGSPPGGRSGAGNQMGNARKVKRINICLNLIVFYTYFQTEQSLICFIACPEFLQRYRFSDDYANPLFGEPLKTNWDPSTNRQENRIFFI